MSRKPIEAEVVTPESSSTPAAEPQKQSQLATILIGLLIIASGLLVYNYFQTATAPDTVSVNQQEQGDDTTDNKVAGGTIDAASPSDAGSYTVVAGDTLWSIAEKVYGDGHRWTELDEANSIARNSLGQPIIEVGQVLKAPDSAAKVDTSTTADASDEAPAKDGDSSTSEEVKAQTHTVVHGETLWSIAQHYYGDGDLWPVIFNFEANNLSELADGTPLIHAGNTLTLPPVLPGD